MTNFERFDERKLPNKEGFYSFVKDKHISDKSGIKSVLGKFGMNLKIKILDINICI